MADDAEFESVITDEMQAQVGKEHEGGLSEVTTTSVRMFARSVGYDDPVYYDQEVAKERGYRDLPAPPGYLGTPVFDPRNSDPTFGGRRGSGPRIQSPYTLVLNGGTDVEYFDEPIVAGDTLSSSSQLESLNERYSAALGGPMLIQVSKTTYTNQAGAVVAVMRGTGISYGPKRES
jgi:acyl dehydratase